MQPPTHLPVFDGHNDVLLRHYHPAVKPLTPLIEGAAEGHIDLPRARAGGLAGGLFALFVPSEPDLDEHPGAELAETPAVYALPPAAPVELARAQAVTLRGIATLLKLEAASAGKLRVVETSEALRTCLDGGVTAAVMHIEGAEAIDPDLDALHVLHRAGLRSVGITWSRSNRFGHGVPFRFPASPDTGPGLTEAGVRLVGACNALGIVVDVAHLNEQGFWDVARTSQKPLVASHCGAHAVCPSTRNLTDRQLDAVAASHGIVGINFHVAFLRPDGHRTPDTPLEVIVRHIDYVVERTGIDHVGFGSDFDGAVVPAPLGDVAGLPKLLQALRERGYDDTALRKLSHANWLRVLDQTL